MQMNSNSIKKVKSILQTFRCTLHKLFRRVLLRTRWMVTMENWVNPAAGILHVVIKGLIENGDDIVAAWKLLGMWIIEAPGINVCE